MPATRIGGLKAAQTNKLRYGDDFYRKIGATGGKKSRGGGFASDPELAKLAGAKGGRISRRGKTKIVIDKEEYKTALDELSIYKKMRKYLKR